MSVLKKKLRSWLFNFKVWYWRKTTYKRYYLDFTQEMIMDNSYTGYVAGRIELCNGNLSAHSIDEQRIFTNDVKEFYKLVDKYSYKDGTMKQMNKMLKEFEQYDCRRC